METLGPIIMGSIHLMAAIVLLGGGLYSSYVLRPSTFQIDPREAGKLSGLAGQRFSMIAWACVAILLITGVVRSYFMGAFAPEILFGTTYGTLLIAKIALFIVACFTAALITKTGINMSKLAEAGSAPDVMMSEEKKLHTYAVTTDLLTIVIVVLAVSMRVIGLPEA